jgi:lipid A 3-O-deacylase
MTLSGGEGVRDQDHEDLRAGLQWGWNRRWLQRSAGHLTGYWDLSIAHWRTDVRRGGANDSGSARMTGLAFAPVLRLQFAELGTIPIAPFFEIGIGLALLSDDEFRSGRRNSLQLGSHWQFEDRAVAGARFGSDGRFEFAYQLLHYSNANLASGNRGLDSHMLMLGMRF